MDLDQVLRVALAVVVLVSRGKEGAGVNDAPGVLGKDGDLTGYRWGVARKRALLEKERAAARPKAGAAQG